jgi:hypothetical protein
MPTDPWSFWMRIWLARTRIGEQAAAAEELSSFADDLASTNPESLSSQIVGLVLGKLPMPNFLESLNRLPHSRNDKARAYFYAGERAMAHGDGLMARELLIRCAKEKAMTSPEASTAAAELHLFAAPEGTDR